jgi:hypothetical protein
MESLAAYPIANARREIIRLESDDREDQLALQRWADDGGYCPPDPEDTAAADRGLALVTIGEN